MTDRHVVKLGGSQLKHLQTPARLRRWLGENFSNSQLNLLVGGGGLIDVLRELDTTHAFNATAMHWRCIRALRLTFELVSEWLPELNRIETLAEFESHQTNHYPGHFLIAVDSFYSPTDGSVLPENWSTTSDSIAALLAHKMCIKQLWLLKSCVINADFSIEQAIKAGVVDEAFGAISKGLDVKWARI